MDYHAETTIAASPECIWAILTDGGAYPEWDPNMIRVEGKIALGSTLKVFTKLSPKRAFPVDVTTFRPGACMVWSGGMPLGLFKGERTFTLTRKGRKSTHFSMREVFSGPLLFLFRGQIPDLSESFTDFAAALKVRAERFAN